jgi:hypothetical protein
MWPQSIRCKGKFRVVSTGLSQSAIAAVDTPGVIFSSLNAFRKRSTLNLLPRSATGFFEQ